MKQTFTAIIFREEDMVVALAPELDVASQGASVEDAKANLQEAIELFLEVADKDEIRERMHADQYVSSVEVAIG